VSFRSKRKVTCGDAFLFRVRRQPAFAFSEGVFSTSSIADPVMLVSVQYRNEDIDMRQQFLQTLFDREGGRNSRAPPPIPETAHRAYDVQPPLCMREARTGSAENDSPPRQGNAAMVASRSKACLREFLALLTPAAQRSAEHTRGSRRSAMTKQHRAGR